ncbi:MAG TPA: carboxypeptidase-like regulatory domain-containing protein [Flavobacteriales bacterium]|nr:carboxypeptidase-like regulatory domain-containing protein [Flavobacteriales bacterium]
MTLHLRYSFRLQLVCLLVGLGHFPASAQPLVVVVSDEEGRPLPGAHVSLRDARDRGVKPTSKKDGVFTFEKVPEGYDALQVKAAGRLLNGCQWFGTHPDAIRMTLRKGPYYLIDEGHWQARLVFDERRLEVDYHRGVRDDSLRTWFAEQGLACERHTCTYLRRKGGGKFMLHHNTALEAVRKNKAVVSAGLYAEHQKRHLQEGVGVTPHAGLSMSEQHQYRGIVRVTFDPSAMNVQLPQGYLQEINWLLDRFGFRLTDSLSGYMDEGLLYGAFGYPGLEMVPVSGLAGPFLIGQLEQLAKDHRVRKVELVVPMTLD